MNAKTFLFVAAWTKPLKTLPLEQRWNVIEAITEYATTGQMTMELDPMESMAFLFIRNEIDRMKNYRTEQLERRRSIRRDKDKESPIHPEATNEEQKLDANNAKDAKACNDMQGDAPFDIISVSESVSESESESEKKSSTTARACVREGTPENNFLSGIQPPSLKYRAARSVGRMLRIRPHPTNGN